MRAPRPSPRASAGAPLRQMPVCETHGLGASESPSLPTLPAPVQPRRPPSPRLLFGARSEVICVLTRLRWSSPQGQHLWVLSAAPPALLGQGLARSRRSDLSLRLRLEEPARQTVARRGRNAGPERPRLGSRGARVGRRVGPSPAAGRCGRREEPPQRRARPGRPGLPQTDKEHGSGAPGPGFTDGRDG